MVCFYAPQCVYVTVEFLNDHHHHRKVLEYTYKLEQQT